MRKTIYSLALLAVGVLAYRYRYQALNGVLRIGPVQKLLVRVGMGIPAVRQAIISQVFR